LLSGVLLLLAFVGLLVVLLARVVVGVVVGVVGGLVIGLLRFSRVVFTSDFGFPLPVSCIGVLGLPSHEEEGFWLAVTLRDFVLEAGWKPFVKSVSKGRVAPIAARG
jgi:uncharacterized membrane protein YraQ (UPF0718 family)